MKRNRWVVCAAVQHRHTKEITCGPRHHHCFRKIVERYGEGSVAGNYAQGFIDQDEVFMDRHEAYKVASLNGQIRFPDEKGGVLFSENLY